METWLVQAARTEPEFRLVVTFLWSDMHNVDADGDSDNRPRRGGDVDGHVRGRRGVDDEAGALGATGAEAAPRSRRGRSRCEESAGAPVNDEARGSRTSSRRDRSGRPSASCRGSAGG